MQFKNLTLEISLKPFRERTEAESRAVAEKLFEHWRALIEESNSVNLMFWAADGSEILDYRGNLDDTFEWAYYIGVANAMPTPDNIKHLPLDLMPIHTHPQLYCENPKLYSYRELKQILTTMRTVFKEKYNRHLGLVATFDPGPEFAKSDFKYKRHPEICLAHSIGHKTFVCCYGELNADSTVYAGFPKGIPQGTSLGTFLGRQFKHYGADLGFDSLWMSNGFGFGLETWGITGAVFDGEDFTSKRCPEVKEKIFGFWNDFRQECPDTPILTRGTNFTAGKDLSSDGVPLRDIFRKVSNLQPPPNSPWAALNSDFGLELVGWLSHIAELPGESYPFRFYIHDPWFINSPWLDRYGRYPHDLYLPFALTRLNSTGKATRFDVLNLLTVDDSYGRMPDQVPMEVIPHVLDCCRKTADAAGPLVWLYPFDEYHDITFDGTNIREVFFGDWFMRTAVNSGLPLNGVISTKNYLSMIKAGNNLNGNIIVTPTATADNDAVLEELQKFVKAGGQVLFYGPIRSKKLQQMFGLQPAAPLTGEMEFTSAEGGGKVLHQENFCGGAVDLGYAAGVPGTEVTAWYVQGTEKRPAVVWRQDPSWNGSAVWVRGTNSFTVNPKAHLPDMLDRKKYFYPETCMRTALRRFGYQIDFVKYAATQQEPIILFRRCRRGLYLAEYAVDTTVAVKLRLPSGMPVFTGSEMYIDGQQAKYSMPKTANWECRVLIEQAQGVIRCREWTVDLPRFKRAIEITGLENATVRFLAEDDTVPFMQTPPAWDGKILEPAIVTGPEGKMCEVKNISGTLSIKW